VRDRVPLTAERWVESGHENSQSPSALCGPTKHVTTSEAPGLWNVSASDYDSPTKGYIGPFGINDMHSS
jgi:hypothetical protein